MVLGKLDIHVQIIKLSHYLTPYIKNNLKWIRDLYLRSETIRLLKENLGKNLLDNGLCNEFLYVKQKHKQQKQKINKWD